VFDWIVLCYCKAEESSEKESAPAAKKVKKVKVAKDDASPVIDHTVTVL